MSEQNGDNEAVPLPPSPALHEALRNAEKRVREKRDQVFRVTRELEEAEQSYRRTHDIVLEQERKWNEYVSEAEPLTPRQTPEVG